MNLSKTKKQVSYLYISTLLGTLLGVLVSIVNTRYLDPVDYGDVHYVQNIINFLSGIFLFGYFVSGCRLLAIAKNKKEVREIKGCMVAILLCTVVLMVVLMFFMGLIHHYVLYRPCYYLFYAVMPFCGATLLLNYVNTSSQGDNSIGTIALARLLPSFIYLVAIYSVFSIFGITSIIALLLHTGITFITIAILILQNHPSFHNLRESFRKLNEENKKYGLHVYLGSLSNVSVQYIAGVTLGLFADNNANVGYYSLALTATAPLMMLPNVIGTTYFKRFATQNSIERKVLFGTFFMSALSLILFIILIFPVVNILFNEKYQMVAPYAAFLAFASTFHGLGDVFNRFIGAHGNGKYLRNGAFISGFVAFIGYTFGVYFWSINGAIFTRMLFAISYMGLMLLYYIKTTTQLFHKRSGL